MKMMMIMPIPLHITRLTEPTFLRIFSFLRLNKTIIQNLTFEYAFLFTRQKKDAHSVFKWNQIDKISVTPFLFHFQGWLLLLWQFFLLITRCNLTSYTYSSAGKLSEVNYQLYCKFSLVLTYFWQVSKKCVYSSTKKTRNMSVIWLMSSWDWLVYAHFIARLIFL